MEQQEVSVRAASRETAKWFGADFATVPQWRTGVRSGARDAFVSVMRESEAYRAVTARMITDIVKVKVYCDQLREFFSPDGEFYKQCGNKFAKGDGGGYVRAHLNQQQFFLMLDELRANPKLATVTEPNRAVWNALDGWVGLKDGTGYGFHPACRGAPSLYSLINAQAKRRPH